MDCPAGTILPCYSGMRAAGQTTVRLLLKAQHPPAAPSEGTSSLRPVTELAFVGEPGACDPFCREGYNNGMGLPASRRLKCRAEDAAGQHGSTTECEQPLQAGQ